MTGSAPRHTNRLAREKSPYLLQHAHNPVDWWPWCDEALAEAKRLDKPILVSIGYSTCHWCHVMERESFEDERIARLMNERYICIKVDREERPDVDKAYMDACMALTGQGGWPLNMFLTPDLQPFYGGTYFPPMDHYGRASWPRVLDAVSRAWNEDRGTVLRQAGEIREHLTSLRTQRPGDVDGPQLAGQCADFLRSRYDPEWGGFGHAPKFPKSAECLFLLTRFAATGDEDLRDMALHTLRAMALGGIHDQIGGGFARYATDERWLIPHFEKMLYDNALLLRAYAAGWQVSGEDLFAAAAEGIVAWLAREMTGAHGAFFSAQDADSEGHEGLFYLWTPAEIAEVLGEADAAKACALWDVTEKGNFEGRNILHRDHLPLADAAKVLGADAAEVETRVAQWGRRLLEARSSRVPPLSDDKVLTEWNGLMAGALAVAGRSFGRQDWVKRGAAALQFVHERLVDGEGRLQRRWRDGEAAGLAILDDYACLGSACLDLFETTGEVAWFDRALHWASEGERLFADGQGGWFQTGSDAPVVLGRVKDTWDGATPSGYAVMATLHARLLAFTGDHPHQEAASNAGRACAGDLARAPFGFITLVGALEELEQGAAQLLFRHEGAWPWDGEVGGLLGGAFLPHTALAPVSAATQREAARRIPFANGRDGGPVPEVHLCRANVCRLPVRDVDALRVELARSGFVLRP